MISIPNFIVIIVAPKYEGNLGAIARAMKNFGLDSLRLIEACEIGDECYRRSKHAKDIIENAEKYSNFEDALRDIEFVVGTTGLVNTNIKRTIRNPLSVREFVPRVRDIPGNVGLVFGREDYGLYDDELKKCDIVITIPTDSEYRIMNLSHAAAVVFYELYEITKQKYDKRRDIEGTLKKKLKANMAREFENELLYEQFKLLLDDIDYPDYKKENTAILFRRLIGRAFPTKWDFHTLMGVFKRARGKVGKTGEKAPSEEFRGE